jgi:hypothetical protein
MRGVVKVRRWWPLVVVCALWGCGDECAEAVSLCEECELKPEGCEALFKDKSTEFCRAAVADYEAGCTE